MRYVDQCVLQDSCEMKRGQARRHNLRPGHCVQPAHNAYLQLMFLSWKDVCLTKSPFCQAQQKHSQVSHVLKIDISSSAKWYLLVFKTFLQTSAITVGSPLAMSKVWLDFCPMFPCYLQHCNIHPWSWRCCVQLGIHIFQQRMMKITQGWTNAAFHHAKLCIPCCILL